MFCGALGFEYGISNVECRMWNVECGIWNVECRISDVKFGMPGSECMVTGLQVGFVL